MKNIKIAVLSALLLAAFSCKKEDSKVVKPEETKTEVPVSNQKNSKHQWRCYGDCSCAWSRERNRWD